MNRREEDYYPEIGEKFEELLSANLDSVGSDVNLYWRENEKLSHGLNDILSEEGIENPELKEFVRNTLPLDLDIFFLARNPATRQWTIIILEVKKKDSLGLMNFSQMVGYSLVSKAEFALLVNIDEGMSDRLAEILEHRRDVTEIERTVGEKSVRHKYGVMSWDSETQDFVRTDVEPITSIPSLAEHLSESLSN